MQKSISTNLHLPFDLWKEVKVYAAQQGKTMREVVIEGLRLLLHPPAKPALARKNLLLKYAGKATANVKDASVRHDFYLES